MVTRVKCLLDSGEVSPYHMAMPIGENIGNIHKDYQYIGDGVIWSAYSSPYPSKARFSFYIDGRKIRER